MMCSGFTSSFCPWRGGPIWSSPSHDLPSTVSHFLPCDLAIQRPAVPVEGGTVAKAPAQSILPLAPRISVWHPGVLGLYLGSHEGRWWRVKRPPPVTWRLTIGTLRRSNDNGLSASGSNPNVKERKTLFLYSQITREETYTSLWVKRKSILTGPVEANLGLGPNKVKRSY